MSVARGQVQAQKRVRRTVSVRSDWAGFPLVVGRWGVRGAVSSGQMALQKPEQWCDWLASGMTRF